MVTGAGGGIGGAVLEALLAAGARVLAADRDIAGIARSDAVELFACDVTDPRAVDTVSTIWLSSSWDGSNEPAARQSPMALRVVEPRR